MATEESAKAADAYAAYRDLGPSRSLAKLAEQWGKRETYVGQLERWCSQFSWVQRAKAWDEEQRETERLKKAADIAAMNERHAKLGMDLQQKAIAQIETLIAANKFGSQATVMALKLALDSERLARGDVTERVEQQQNGSISVVLTPAAAQQIAEATPDELAEWRKKRGLPPPTEERLG